jgi:hypothetical protein
MMLSLATEEQEDWDPNDKTFSETEVTPVDNAASQNTTVESGQESLSNEKIRELREGRRDSGEGRREVDLGSRESVSSVGKRESVTSGGRGESARAISQVSSATNVTPMDSIDEEPQYEIPMSFLPRDRDVTPHDRDVTTRDVSRSPVYATVQKPSRLKLSQSLTTRPGTLSPGSGVVSYASSVVTPHQAVSDYPISKQYTLGWVPRIPKKQRCVQVILFAPS